MRAGETGCSNEGVQEMTVWPRTDFRAKRLGNEWNEIVLNGGQEIQGY